MEFNIIYEDKNLLVIDKPAGVNADDFPLRVHRLDKDTSGLLLIAKNDEALKFFQKQFKERRVEKKYIALVAGSLKNQAGEIKTLLGRSAKDRRKQKVYLAGEPNSEGKREAITEYKVLAKFENFSLIEVSTQNRPKTPNQSPFSLSRPPDCRR